MFATFHCHSEVYNSGVPVKFMVDSRKRKALNIALPKLAKVFLTRLHLYYILVINIDCNAII